MGLENAWVQRPPADRMPVDPEFLLKFPEWTPEAIAAAGGIERLDVQTLAERRRFPDPYKLAGEPPDKTAKHVAAVLEILERRHMSYWLIKGGAIQIDRLADRFYVTFTDDHEFQEASGGDHEYYGPDDFHEFLARIDTPARLTKLEIRNGFRVLVYTEPRIGEAIQ